MALTASLRRTTDLSVNVFSAHSWKHHKSNNTFMNKAQNNYNSKQYSMSISYINYNRNHSDTSSTDNLWDSYRNTFKTSCEINELQWVSQRRWQNISDERSSSNRCNGESAAVSQSSGIYVSLVISLVSAQRWWWTSCVWSQTHCTISHSKHTTGHQTRQMRRPRRQA